MKYIISRYNQDLTWLKDYTDDYVLYDRSEQPLEGAIIVPNIGTDIYDKFTYIIDNYDNLPDVAIYTKANLFKYITKEEFDLVKDNKTFMPLLTQTHAVGLPMGFYSKDGMYNELNEDAVLILNKPSTKYFDRYWKFAKIFNLPNPTYLKFAPGSNYILPKEHILKYPKEFYHLLREILSHDIYPGEAQIIERALYYIWS